jgi:hypothetical protein
MKSINSRKKSQERVKSNTQLMGMVMLTLMVLSIAGFAFLSGGGTSSSGNVNPEVQEDGHLGFSNQGFWVVNIGGQQLGFSNSPDSVVNVSVDINDSINDYIGQAIYYSGDFEIREEFARTINPFIGDFREACLGKCSEDLPEKTCSDRMIIWDKESSSNSVRQEENCVFIDGDLKSVDAFLYKLLGL